MVLPSSPNSAGRSRARPSRALRLAQKSCSAESSSISDSCTIPEEFPMEREAECPVLLIEDEPDAAKLVQYVLSKGTAPKLAVDWAPNLRSGLERLTEREFEAILLDLNLPDSSGFETFARVRQQTAEGAVIVLTAQEDEALALQAVRSGAD